LAPNLFENDVELAALDWLQQSGYSTVFAPFLAPDQPGAERESLASALIEGRLRSALQKLNPKLPAEALEEAFRKITIPQSVSLIANNRAFHKMLVEGIAVECRRKDGSLGTEIVQLLDFAEPERNDWLAVNQFTIIEGQH
jgi:type I restriction enzyme, R subunit